MGSALSWLFGPKDPRTPIRGCGPRIKNIIIVHYRGVLGTLVPLILLSWQPEKGKHDITVRCVWLLMFWSMLIHPIAVAAAGLIPLFLLPMTGVASTVVVASCYFNDTIALYVIGGMLHMLLNSSGLDRRLILWLLCSGDNCQFSGKRLVFKASTAAFFLSMFSNRLITTSTITQFLSSALVNLQSVTSRNRKTEPNYDEMRYIILNAVQTASTIGSITILHAALTPITMKAVWSTNLGADSEYADIFNYMEYTCFAFPVAFFMFIFNFIYHMMLINCIIGKAMSGSSMTEMRNFLIKQQNALPKSNCFEKETIFFYALFLIACLFRWSEWLYIGWATFRNDFPGPPMIKDATIAATFLVVLSILPRSPTIFKYFIAENKSDLKGVKPDSAILWWRFVDKNTYYGYVFLIGGVIALNHAIRTSNLGDTVTKSYGTFITDNAWNLSIFLVCLISVFLANIMTGIAACCSFLPFVLNMALEGAPEVWRKRLHLGALGVGIATSFSFLHPYLHTPAYFCHFTGKVPINKMRRYGLGSLIICFFILWLALCFYAPLIFDPDDVGIRVFSKLPTTEEAPPEAPPPEPEA